MFQQLTRCSGFILHFRRSGIVSLFFCGIVMAHYAMYNVSKTTQTSSHHVFKSFAMLAETFVFGYLGIYAGIHLEKLDQNWSFLMIVFSLVCSHLPFCCQWTKRVLSARLKVGCGARLCTLLPSAIIWACSQDSGDFFF